MSGTLRAAEHRTAGRRPGCGGRAPRWTAGSPGCPCTGGWSHGAARGGRQDTYTQDHSNTTEPISFYSVCVCVCVCVLPWGRSAAAARCSSCTRACWCRHFQSHSEPSARSTTWWSAEGEEATFNTAFYFFFHQRHRSCETSLVRFRWRSQRWKYYLEDDEEEVLLFALSRLHLLL